MDATTTKAIEEPGLRSAESDPGDRAEPTSLNTDSNGEVLIEEELLVEEVSIDGMCGVY
jgi:mycofactocin precursor